MTEWFLLGGGEMGERLRAFDWSRSPLGLPATWPRSRKAAVHIARPRFGEEGACLGYAGSVIDTDGRGRAVASAPSHPSKAPRAAKGLVRTIEEPGGESAP